MPDHQLIGPYGSDYPRALAADGRRIGDAPDPSEVVLRVFPAASWDAAVQLYLRCKQVGIAATLGGKHGRRKVGPWWQFGGASNHLIDSAVRLGISTGAIHRAEADATLKNTSTRIGEAYGRYKLVKGPTRPDRDFSPEELRHIKILIDRCEVDDARLHAMADACREMIEECRAEFGMPAGEYRYRVIGPEDNHDATAPLRAEIDRLEGELASEAVAKQALEAQQDEIARIRNEHAELLEQNRQLATMVESLTAPVPSDPTGPAIEAAPQSPPKPAPPRPNPKGR